MFKLMKKPLALLLALALVISVVPSTVSAAEDTAADIASGDIGENNAVHWVIDNDGTLTISGKGAIPACNPGYAPWNQYKDSIFHVVIEKGITSIGTVAGSMTVSNSFYNCTNIKDVVISNSVTYIGQTAFAGCTSLEKVVIPDSVTSIAKNAFDGCDIIGKLTIYGKAGSYAATFAETNNIWFLELSDESDEPDAPDEPDDDSNDLNVTKHTWEEIQAFVDKNPATLSDSVTYSVEPSLKEPYAFGVLSDETQESALNMLNQVRFIAGINYDVTWDPKLSEYTSAGTLLNYLNDELTHTPVRPDVLSDSAYDDLYKIGETGALTSNLAMRYSSNLNDAIINGWMADASTAENIKEVGHRRWFLSTLLKKVGFGVTDKYYGAYIMHNIGSSDKYVAWPAQEMPVDYFAPNYPWSVSVGYSLEGKSVSVSLVRKSDGRTWNFSKSGSDGKFSTDNTQVGSQACISFLPNSLDKISAGDSFDVNILISGSDSDEPISINYTVNFFALKQSGTIGKNDAVKWSIDHDGTLTISGEGAMSWSGSVAPWRALGVGDARNISRVVIEDGITSIGSYAFSECKSLEEVLIPDSVTQIGSNAFNSCTSLKEVTIPGSVTKIDMSAFRLCTSLEKVTIEEGATSIGDYAFEYCTSLKKVVIPKSVTKIGYNAFNMCKKMTIYGKAGSYAESYAKQNNIPFIVLIEIDEEQTDTAYEKGSSEGVTIKCFANVSDLVSVYVDGIEIDAESYTLEGEEGFTVIKFTPEFMDTLEDGKHTFKLEYPEGREVEVSITVTEPGVPDDGIIGDVDDNGIVDADDALAILKYKVNIPLAVFVEKAADVDNNGIVDADDALAILKYKAGILDENFKPKK